MIQCPVCMNSEPELIVQSQDDFRCACGAAFTVSGEVIVTSS
jgi:hypothetical protein